MTELGEAARLASDYIEKLAADMGDSGWAISIWKAARPLLPEGKRSLAPGEIAAKGWRYRVLLFNAAGSCEADTMPGRELEDEPEEWSDTLPALAQGLRELAEGFHSGHLVEGLDRATLERAIVGLRVSQSRGGQWWNRPYSVDGQDWSAKIKVVRAS